MKYRLGIDLGSTSLGWCVLKLDKNDEIDGVENAGVRIFHDGRNEKDKKPLAVARREARGIRRNRDRYKRRRTTLMKALVEFGLMPKDIMERKKIEILDPYEIRAKAIKNKVSPYELGRALFHINQRRGFKSNRKSDKKSSEKGIIAIAAGRMKEELEKNGYRTIGEFFYDRHKKGESVRVRMIEDGYEVYPLRAMYEDEYNKIFQEQKKHNSNLEGNIENELKNIIFFQRELRAQEVGYCELEDNEKRVAKAHPLFQEFRIEQDVNNLETDGTTGEYLSEDHRKKIKIALKLAISKELSFDKLKKVAGINRKARLNFESEKRKGLKSDATKYFLSKAECFGNIWVELSQEKREEVVGIITSDKKDAEVSAWLKKEFKFDDVKIENIMNSPLEDGYASLSEKAIRKLLPFMINGKRYDEACALAGYHHSDHRQEKIIPALPYYGEAMPKKVIGGKMDPKDKDFPEKYYGKINNPTVHIALNQLRRVVNALIKKYGNPSEIAVEMARELKTGTEGLSEIEKKQTANQKDNERINVILKKNGLEENGENRLKYKLWEDLAEKPQNRRCVFTGKQISVKDIWSDKFEIEHLLPFSRTYDDGRSNKTICAREANRKKKNNTPFEAFGNSKGWPEIMKRAANLPENVQWRFRVDAMKKYEEQGGAIARMLNDTRYMSKIAKEYLGFICNPDKVDVTPGQLTAILRGAWGLNYYKDKGKKETYRTDHRHHAIDAFVIGCTTKGMLQLASKCSEWADKAGGQHEGRVKLFKGKFEPYENYGKEEREKLREIIENVVVSYKPDHKGAEEAIREHSTTGSLHQDTAYGPTDIKSKEEGKLVVSARYDIHVLTEKDIDIIADKGLAKELSKLFKILDADKRKRALDEYSKKNNIRKVKCLLEKPEQVLVPIYRIDRNGNKEEKPYKYYQGGSNYCLDIYCLRPDDKREPKNAGKWQGEVISNFDVHQRGFEPKWRKKHPTAKRIMRLFINDTLMLTFKKNEAKENLPSGIRSTIMNEFDKIEGDNIDLIFKVKKMTQSGQFFIRPHFITKDEKDSLSWGASVSGIYAYKARKIIVNEIGEYKDVGFINGWEKND